MSVLPILGYKKLHEKAIIPVRAHKDDTGYDIFAVEDLCIAPGQRVLVRTGIALEIPENIDVQIRPRSGLAWEKGITVLNTPATIDPGYKGEIKVLLINFGQEEYLVKQGDRIAQLVFTSAFRPYFVEVEQLSTSSRQDSGFGSTGYSSIH